MPDAPSYPPPGPMYDPPQSQPQNPAPGPPHGPPHAPAPPYGVPLPPGLAPQHPGAHGWAPPPTSSGGSAVGVTALVLACVPLVVTNVVGVVIGVVGLTRDRGRTGPRPEGWSTSLAAVVVGTSMLALLSVAGLVVVAGSDEGSSTATSSDDGDLGAWGADDEVDDLADDLADFEEPDWERSDDVTGEVVGFGELSQGDCYWDETFWDVGLGEVPDEVEVVPCDQDHPLQVLGTYELDVDEWPGRMSMFDETEEGCGDLFFELTTDDYVDAYDTWWTSYGPDRDEFEAGEREVLCVFVSDTLLDESAVLPTERGA